MLCAGWRCGGVKICLLVVLQARCVSSVSPRFHYRRHDFCFLPLAAILESLCALLRMLSSQTFQGYPRGGCFHKVLSLVQILSFSVTWIFYWLEFILLLFQDSEMFDAPLNFRWTRKKQNQLIWVIKNRAHILCLDCLGPMWTKVPVPDVNCDRGSLDSSKNNM
jgi:hypothetical protein